MNREVSSRPALRLNSTITTATSVTQQAVVLDTLLAESKANIEGKPGTPNGNPCAMA